MTKAFNFKTNYVLEDNCVLMQPLTHDDCKNLLYFSLNEPTTWQYGFVSAAGEDNLKKYIADAEQGRSDQKMYAFSVFDKRTNAYAGSTRFYDVNLAFKTVQLGYTWYGEQFRGTGLNMHCKYLLLEFAFEQMDMQRVEFRADARNARSIAAMKKIGCIEEGILREDMPLVTGGRRSSMILSILKNEWEQTVREKIGGML